MKPSPRMPALLLALSLAASFPGPAAAAETPADAVREGLLEQLNGFRRDAGSPPLTLDAAVSRAATEQAEELASRRSLDLPADSADRMQERLSFAGYAARRWVEGLMATSEPLESWVGDWAEERPRELSQALDPRLRHLGIGLAKVGQADLFVLLVTEPVIGPDARRVSAEPVDLATLRRQMLDQLNALRRKEGLPGRLAASGLLDRIAQKHADDLLARGYFAHRSPDGKTVRERAEREGYRFRTLGENLAEGQESIDRLLAGWYDSPPHHSVLLDRAVEELGLGRAHGRDDKGRARLVWVLVVGAPRR
jgi:uncharacterized protein YkwD